MMERRDRIGRRIGRNWWREYVTGAYRDARDQWLVQFDLDRQFLEGLRQDQQAAA